MPFLDPSFILDFQDQGGSSDFQQNQNGLIDAVVERGNPTLGQRGSFLTPTALETLRTISGARDNKIPVIKDDDAVVVTTPGFDQIPDNLPNSDQYGFTAFDIFSGMRFYPGMYGTNAISAEFERDNRMQRILRAMATKLEEVLSTVAETRKTQLLNFTTQASQGSGTFVFDGTGDTLNISKDAQRETMFHNMTSLAVANKLPGNYSLVGSPLALLSHDSAVQQSGANNAVNLQYPMNQWIQERYYQSHFLQPGADNFSGYFMRDGSLGMVSNHPYDFINGTEINGMKWGISPVPLQGIRMRPNIYINNNAVDATSLVKQGAAPIDTNLLMSHFEEMAIWLRVYVVYPYQTDFATRANDIWKLRGLTT